MKVALGCAAVALEGAAVALGGAAAALGGPAVMRKFKNLKFKKCNLPLLFTDLLVIHALVALLFVVVFHILVLIAIFVSALGCLVIRWQHFFFVSDLLLSNVMFQIPY